MKCSRTNTESRRLDGTEGLRQQDWDSIPRTRMKTKDAQRKDGRAGCPEEGRQDRMPGERTAGQMVQQKPKRMLDSGFVLLQEIVKRLRAPNVTMRLRKIIT